MPPKLWDERKVPKSGRFKDEGVGGAVWGVEKVWGLGFGGLEIGSYVAEANHSGELR